MKKWYAEEYEWEIEVIGFIRGSKKERYCRNGEESGGKYTCTGLLYTAMPLSSTELPGRTANLSLLQKAVWQFIFLWRKTTNIMVLNVPGMPTMGSMMPMKA